MSYVARAARVIFIGAVVGGTPAHGRGAIADDAQSLASSHPAPACPPSPGADPLGATPPHHPDLVSGSRAAFRRDGSPCEVRPNGPRQPRPVASTLHVASLWAPETSTADQTTGLQAARPVAFAAQETTAPSLTAPSAAETDAARLPASPSVRPESPALHPAPVIAASEPTAPSLSDTQHSARGRAHPSGDPAPAPPSEPATGDESFDDGTADRTGSSLRETVVRAAAPQATSSRLITSRELSLTPRRSPDELLRWVPGLWTSPHGAEGKAPQLFLRGFDAVHGADLEVRVGGFALNEMSNVHGQGYLDLGLLIPEVVTSIRVDKGALDIDQGPFATAGTVRFELGVPEDARGVRLSYELGSTSRHRAVGTWAPRGAPPETFVAAEAMTDRGYGVNRASRRVVLLGQASLPAPDWLGRVTALLGAHAASFGEPGVLPLAAVQSDRIGFHDSLPPYGSGRSERVLAGVTLERAVGRGRITARLHAQARHLALDENFTGWLLDPIRGDRRLQQQGLVGAGAELHYERPLTPGLLLRAGATWTQEALSQRETRLDPEGEPWERARHLGVHQSTTSARAALAWRPVTALRIEGGLRLDAFRLQTRDRLTEREASTWLAALAPRLRARLMLAPGWTLALGAGRGVRPPEARTVLADAGAGPAGQEEPPARIDGAELGVTFAPSPILQASLSSFAAQVSDEVTFDHVSGTNLEAGESRRVGVELGARLAPLRWLEFRGELSLTEARYVVTGEAVPNAPRLLASLWSGATHPSGLRGGMQVFVLGPRPLAHRAQAGALASIDLVVGWRRGPWDLSLSVDNLLDARLRAGEYHFASAFDPGVPGTPLPALHFSAGPPRMLRTSVGLTL